MAKSTVDVLRELEGLPSSGGQDDTIRQLREIEGLSQPTGDGRSSTVQQLRELEGLNEPPIPSPIKPPLTTPPSIGVTRMRAAPRGALDVVGTALEGSELRTRMAGERARGFAPVGIDIRGMPDDDFNAFVQGAVRAKLPGAVKQRLVSTIQAVRAGGLEQSDFDEVARSLQRNLPAEAKQAIRDFSERFFPIPREQEQDLGVQVLRGIGSTAGFVGTRLLPGGQVLLPGFAASVGSGEAIQRAAREGVDNETQARAALMGIVPGMTDIAPIERLFRPIARIPGVKGALLGIARKAVEQGLVEGTQEAVQNFLQNAIQRIASRPDQSLTEGMDRDALVGFIVGSVFGAGAGAINRTRAPTQPGPLSEPSPVEAGPQAQPAPEIEQAPPQPEVSQAAAVPADTTSAPSAAETRQEPTIAPPAPMPRPALPTQSDTRALTPQGRAVDTQFEVVEGGQLTTSNTSDLAVNPSFPRELQPRDRSRPVSQDQIANIAANLQPELLGASPSTTDGAPIVGEDNVVESGNARVLAIRRAQDLGLPSAERYRAFLEEQGFDTSGFRNPILVRRRTTPLSQDERIAFTTESNQRTTAGFSASEQADTDARGVPDETLNLFRGGDLGSVANVGFVRAFVDATIPQADRPTVITADGQLSQDGRRRIENSLFARAYGDTELLAALREDPDTNFRAIGGAMVDVAPLFAQVRADVERGEIPRSLDLSPSIREAVAFIRRARRTRGALRDLVAQGDLISGRVSPATQALLRIMFRDEAFTLPASRKKVADALTFYATEARKADANPQLFAGGQASPVEILRLAAKHGTGTLLDIVETPQVEATAVQPVAVDARPTRRPQRQIAGQPPQPPALPPAPPPSGREPSGIFEPRVRSDLGASVAAAAQELMAKGNVRRRKGLKLSEQILELLVTNRLSPPEVSAILDRHGVTYQEFAQLWRRDVAQSARDLGRLGIVERRLRAMHAEMSPDEKAELEAALGREGLDFGASALPLWKRLDNIRRGLLVVQPATAIRNAETQILRVGVDALEQSIDMALKAATGRLGAELHPAAVFGMQMRLFGRNKKLANEILSAFPAEHDRLFFRYASDLNRVGGTVGTVLEGAELATQHLNALNRFQEYLIRRAVFLGTMDRLLAGRGLPRLAQLEKSGELHRIPREVIQSAVDRSLEFTFAKSFSPGSAASDFINLVNRVPGFTLAIPFPRFLMNSVKFMYDFSPVAWLKMLSRNERAKIARGDFKAINRAVVGTAMFLAAYAIRDDEDLAGERWYEIRLPDGRTLDIRPFNPFAAHFFLADIVKRFKDGTVSQLSVGDFMQGLLSVNVRAGTGLFLIDSIINGLSGLGDAEKAERFLKRLAAETLSGPLVGVQVLRDVVAEFDEKQRVIKDTSEAPFVGPFLRKLPFGTEGFPEVELPTREGPLITQGPILRQLTGAIIRQEKNIVEKELDRLGFRRSEFAPGTGDPEADRLINKNMGPVVERWVAPQLLTPGYQAQTDNTKALILQDRLREARRFALDMAREENPKLFAKLRFKRRPLRERRAIKDLLGRDPAELLERAQ